MLHYLNLCLTNDFFKILKSQNYMKIVKKNFKTIYMYTFVSEKIRKIVHILWFMDLLFLWWKIYIKIWNISEEFRSDKHFYPLTVFNGRQFINIISIIQQTERLTKVLKCKFALISLLMAFNCDDDNCNSIISESCELLYLKLLLLLLLLLLLYQNLYSGLSKIITLRGLT